MNKEIMELINQINNINETTNNIKGFDREFCATCCVRSMSSNYGGPTGPYLPIEIENPIEEPVEP